MVLAGSSLALLLFLPQATTPELLDLETAPAAPQPTFSRVVGSAAGRLWFTGRREGQTTETWTVPAPGANFAPFHFGPLSATPLTLQAVYDLGNGRALLATGSSLTSTLDLYVSDGTADGTEFLEVRLADAADPKITIAGGRAYFAGRTDDLGTEVYVTDGTASGTSLLVDLQPGPPSTLVRALGVFGSSLLLRTPAQLWSIPISGGPAVQLLGGLQTSLAPPRFREVSGGLVFPFTPSTTLGTELFISDGTPAGTGLVKEINTGIPSLVTGSNPKLLDSDGITTYLLATTEQEGTELWRTDGTAQGTQLVADLEPGPGSPSFASIGQPVAAETALLGSLQIFRARTQAEGDELWVSDGTSAGTQPLTSFASDSVPGLFTGDIAVVGSRVVFSAFQSATGSEPWITDGTTAGTALLVDYAPGSEGSLPRDIADLGGLAYLIASDGVPLNAEPVSIDLATSSVAPLGLAQAVGNRGSAPQRLVSEAGVGYFSAFQGQESLLFRTDGTPSETSALAGSEGSQPPVGILDGRVVFMLEGGPEGREPWISNTSGTSIELLADLTPGPDSSLLFGPTRRLGDSLYAFGRANSLGTELYRTDGTAAGTGLAVELAAGSASGLSDFTVVGERLFLRGGPSDDPFDRLYVSDGTQAGTQVFAPAILGSDIAQQILERDDRLYVLTLTPGSPGARIWSTSGVESDLILELELDGSGRFDVVDGRLLVVQGGRLLAAQPDGSTLELLDQVSYEGAILQARTESHVYVLRENPDLPQTPALWATDGTPAGTVQIADSVLFESFNFSGAPVAQGDRLFFSSGSLDTGFEPWVSDGTPAGTVPLAELTSGFDGSNATALGRVGDRYLFSAFEPATGREPYVVELEETGAHAAQAFGAGCGQGTSPDLDLVGEALLGASVSVEASEAPPGVPVLLYAASGSAYQDLGACALYLNGLLSIGAGLSAASGTAAFDFQLSSDPKWLGVPLYLQAAAIQPGGPFLGLVELTNGLELVFGPQ